MLQAKLIDELTTYPHGRTDDCVMADWFQEWNLPKIYSPEPGRGQAVATVVDWECSLAMLGTRGVGSRAEAMMQGAVAR